MKRRCIDFVIGNDGHHVETFEPVIHCLGPILGGKSALRIVSFCELRGIPTPARVSSAAGGSVVRLFPSGIRRSPAAGAQSGPLKSIARTFVRQLLRQIYLKRTIREWLKSGPHLVVLPNDAVFPYDLICEMLRARSIPFVLVQEGIRFPLPRKDNVSYGSGGAAGIAAWGEASADYFRCAGVEEKRLRLTGCPRFDRIAETDWTSTGGTLRQRLAGGEGIVVLLTNPIDDQGFCSTSQKLDLVASFVRTVAPILEKEHCTLVVKLHVRESPMDYQSALGHSVLGKRVQITEGVPLYPLLAASKAAITMASTAGLEALQFDVPLGVVKLPGFGYAYDYVSSGAAWGLAIDSSFSDRMSEMLYEPRRRRVQVEAYLDRQLYQRTGAAISVANVIAEAVR